MTERYDLIVKDGIVAVFEMPNTLPSTLSAEALDDELARAKGREAVTGLMMQASTATNRSHNCRPGLPTARNTYVGR